MKTKDAKQTIIKVTEMLEKKQRFGFVTYTRSSLFSLLGDLKGDKKPPKSFVQATLRGLTMPDQNFMPAAHIDFLYSQQNKLGKIGVLDKTFYDASFLESYINDSYDVFKIFMNHYFKYNNVLVISFQYKANIAKFFSKDSAFIQVPYNDFYEKVDSVMAQISEFKDAYDICVLDCPMLSAALAPKIWEQTNMSVLDLGKSLTVARSLDRQK